MTMMMMMNVAFTEQYMRLAPNGFGLNPVDCTTGGSQMSLLAPTSTGGG